ncbi:MAG: ribosomal RNA small subunit methyltransferase A [Candidatus Moranbacteria bacterium]|nr:ribosomal RNA small subunit methyltransferase A [Candidatus Moranbacteria bacterium]
MEKFKHKKSLGQNFLNDNEIINNIAANANLTENDIVIEIGPGEGILTQKLAEKSKKVIAIEIDDRLIPILNDKFENTKNIEIIHDGILNINMIDFFAKYKLDNKNYKVIANIPYYITAPIIRLFLELKNPPTEIILMVQKEVAERLTASPGKMSILGISAQYYADVNYLFTVNREKFNPAPKVDSAVVKLEIKNKKTEEDKEFFRVVKIGFSAKRKTLCNNLANGFQRDKKDIENILEKFNLKKNVRAQELSIDDWKKLEKELI